MIYNEREREISQYDRVTIRWIQGYVGYAGFEYKAPYESLFLPTAETTYGEMFAEGGEVPDGMLIVEYYPQTVKSFAPDATYSVVDLIDAINHLCRTTIHSATPEWLHEVRYANHRLYLLCDIPHRYQMQERKNIDLDFVARWLMPSLWLLRYNARSVDRMPDGCILWNHKSHHWHTWEKSPVCKEQNQLRADLLERDTAQQTEARRKQREREREKRELGKLEARRQYEQAQQHLVERIKEELPKHWSLEEFKDAIGVRTLTAIRHLGLNDMIMARFTLDQMTIAQLTQVADEKFQELASHYADPNILKRYHGMVYNYLFRTKKIYELYPDHKQLPNSRGTMQAVKVGRKAAKGSKSKRKDAYTVADIMKVAGECKSYFYFCEMYTNSYYKAASRQGLLRAVRNLIQKNHPEDSDQPVREAFKKIRMQYDRYAQFNLECPDRELASRIHNDDTLRRWAQAFYYKRQQLKGAINQRNTNN